MASGPGVTWTATVFEDGTRHVVPDGDLREHETASPSCWCDPWLEWTDDDNPIFVHRAADRREFYEPDAKRPPDA